MCKEQNSNETDNRLKAQSLEKGDFDRSFQGDILLVVALSLIVKAWSFRQDEEESWGE